MNIQSGSTKQPANAFRRSARILEAAEKSVPGGDTHSKIYFVPLLLTSFIVYSCSQDTPNQTLTKAQAQETAKSSN